jgi:Flp pilus assembly pilin Flp
MTGRRRIFDDSGQDLLEYGLLVALIAVTAVAGIRMFSQTLNTVFWDVIANSH